MATRASLSLSEPNEKWLQQQIESREFSSRSEVVNDLIRKAREIEAIRARLSDAESGGWTSKTRDEILDEIKGKARREGKL